MAMARIAQEGTKNNALSFQCVFGISLGALDDGCQHHLLFARDIYGKLAMR